MEDSVQLHTERGYALLHVLDALRYHRGSLLRAWSLDLDPKLRGWVTQADLAAACRRMSSTADVPRAWAELRPGQDRAPVRFAELAPEEAAQLEELADIFWEAAALDLELIWTMITSPSMSFDSLEASSRMWMSQEEFVRAVQRLGFKGDADLIYSSLDRRGFGRLVIGDLAPLRALTLPAPQRLQTAEEMPALQRLRAWVRLHHMSTASALLSNLGLEPQVGSYSGGWVSIEDFLLRLPKIGYPEEEREEAAAALAAFGWPKRSPRLLTLEALQALLTETSKGFSPEHSERLVRRAQSALPVTPKRCVWNDDVVCNSVANSRLHRNLRAYFSTAKPLRELEAAASAKTPRQGAASPVESLSTAAESSPTASSPSLSPQSRPQSMRVPPGELSGPPEDLTASLSLSSASLSPTSPGQRPFARGVGPRSFSGGTISTEAQRRPPIASTRFSRIVGLGFFCPMRVAAPVSRGNEPPKTCVRRAAGRAGSHLLHGVQSIELSSTDPEAPTS